MIDYRKETAGLDNNAIEKWDVVFQSPLGLHRTMADATEACIQHNLDPNLSIVPVAAAITKSEIEVCSR